MKLWNLCRFVPAVILAAVNTHGALTLQCPPDRTNWICDGSFTFVDYAKPLAAGSGCTAITSVTCVPPSGSAFILGTTTVNCTATNTCRESARCSFDVTVARENMPPTIEAPAMNPVLHAPSTNGIIFTQAVAGSHVKVFDGGTGVAAVDYKPSLGSLLTLGQHSISVVATDHCGNRTTRVFGITVQFFVDTNAPVITCPDTIVAWTCGANAVLLTYPTPSVLDDRDDAPTISCVPPPGTPLPPGITEVTCTATDDAGNQGQCSFEVRVLSDSTPPTIACPPDVFAYSCSSTGRHIVFVPPVADDNDSVASVACVPPNGAFFPVGQTTVTCTATDDCGNTNQCAFLVTVQQDTEPPVISCPSDIVIGTCDPRGTSVSWDAPEATDNGTLYPPVVCTPPPGAIFPVGTTKVTCRVSDSCGNRGECTFDVTVQFNPALARSGIDTDRSGLNDIWEIHFKAQGLSPSEDTDGDGVNNEDEMVAGTDPRNPASVVKVFIAPSDPPPPATMTNRPVINALLGDGSVRYLSYDVNTVGVIGKRYQFQFTPRLGEPWVDLGEPIQQSVSGRITGIVVDPSDPTGNTVAPLATNTTQGFFRVQVMDVDEDSDGVTAWEESILGTSDTSTSTFGWGNDWISGGTGQDGTNSASGGNGRDILIGGLGGDHQLALDWIAGNLGQARLREVALAFLGGSPTGPTQPLLVTATGTGGWLELSSWMIENGSLDPVHLQATPRFEGWNAKLETLEPSQTPALTVNPFVCGRLRDDDNLWLSVRRVDAAGAHSELSTLGYGANASLKVYDYAMAHQAVAGTGAAVPNFLLVTPVMGINTVGQRELRVVTWSITPNSGAITGLFDTGNLGHTNLPIDGGRLQIVRERPGRFVVSYLNQSGQLSSWFFDVENSGQAHPRGGATSGLDIRGAAMEPFASTDFALGPLNAAGFTTLLSDANCNARFAIWEDRIVACEQACYARPFFITDNAHDLKPEGTGVIIEPPVLHDAWDDTAFAGHEYGRVLVAADFNGDGRADAAIGNGDYNVAKEGAPSAQSAGRVHVMYGSASGLAGAYQSGAWTQDSAGMKGLADPGDRFGDALAAGDFDGDGFADLAVGVPGEQVDGVARAGAVNVLYGSSSGLSSGRDQLWHQGLDGLGGTPGNGDEFGFELTTGDFNGDGFQDLAIGVPFDTIEGVDEAGAVHILYGSANGLSATAGPGTQFLSQGSPSLLGTLEAGDRFGQTLAAGDLNGDGRADLVVGIRDEEVNGVNNAGAVQIIYGSANGLGTVDQFIYQGNIQPANDAFPAASETGDAFGWSVTVGDFDDDGFADLAVGVPNEDMEDIGVDDAGVVHILRGSASGVTASGHQLLEDVIAEHGDLMGFALAPGDFNGDGRTDLSVSSVLEDVNINTVIDGGAVTIFHGGAGGLGFAKTFFQNATDDDQDHAEPFDWFGFALAAGDLNGDGHDDLLVGAPKEDLLRDNGNENRIDAGVFHAIHGSASGLDTTHYRAWAQGDSYRIRALLTDNGREAALGIGGGKLFEKMPSGERTNVHVASVTKCMTLVLALELIQTPGANVHFDDIVEVSAKAAGTGGSIIEPPNGPVLEEGDQMPLELLFNAMMMVSCNKSSVAISEYIGRKHYELYHGAVPGGFNAMSYFINTLMQGKADELGMVNTICGHPAGGMVTTPQDLVTLWQYAWQFPDFRRLSGETIFYGTGHDTDGTEKNYSITRTADAYPGLEGWKGGNGGFWDGVSPWGVPFVKESVLGQVTRLDRSLTFALQQTHSRWEDAPAMLDYGYRLLFTPDLRGGGEIAVPGAVDFSVRRVDDTLAVSAVIQGTNSLRLDAWQIVAREGQANSLTHTTRSVTGLPPGKKIIRASLLDLAPVPSLGESEADYVTGHLEGEQLRLNVWRVGAEPGF